MREGGTKVLALNQGPGPWELLCVQLRLLLLLLPFAAFSSCVLMFFFGWLIAKNH
jgi:hypothetical protein